MMLLPGPPDLGPPASYMHATWEEAPEELAIAYYYELSAERYVIRAVEIFADGALRALSFALPNWRDVMPERAIPSIEAIEQEPSGAFSARTIPEREFIAMWRKAQSSQAR